MMSRSRSRRSRTATSTAAPAVGINSARSGEGIGRPWVESTAGAAANAMIDAAPSTAPNRVRVHAQASIAAGTESQKASPPPASSTAAAVSTATRGTTRRGPDRGSQRLIATVSPRPRTLDRWRAAEPQIERRTELSANVRACCAGRTGCI